MYSYPTKIKEFFKFPKNGNRFAEASTPLCTPPPPALRATSPRAGEELPLLDKRGPGGVDVTEGEQVEDLHKASGLDLSNTMARGP